MKYHVKKIIALLMALLMVINMAPVPAFAENGDGSTEPEQDNITGSGSTAGYGQGNRNLPTIVFSEPGGEDYEVTVSGFGSISSGTSAFLQATVYRP